MARTLLNATNGSFLTENDLQGNSFDVIDLNTASEFHQVPAPSKATLNGSVGLADHDYHVMEGFGARDARHEAATSDHNSFRFLSNKSTQVNDAESTASVLSGLSKSDAAINAEGTTAVQTPLKAAASISAMSTSTTADSSGAGAVNVATATTTGFPDATNTGLKAGVAMTKYNGTLHITQDNAVISNMEVNGDIIIDAKNVTLSNVKVNSNGAWTAIKVMDNATGFTLQDSEIDAGSGGNGVYGFGTFLRNNIHNMENGISLSGPSLVQDNYIHTFRGSAEAHYDGIEVNGGSNINIVHNTVVNDQNQTSAVMLDNYFGGLSNITVENNRLVGGGYTVYLDARFDGGAVDGSTIKLINNQVGDGAYGDFAIFDSKPIMSGNTDLDTLPTAAIVYTGTEGNDSLPLAGKADAGAETYKGLGGNDLLKGGAGADTLDGGAGTDTASYAGSTAVKVSLLDTVTGGHATGDKLISIENLIGSSYADTLTGNAGNNVLAGGAGGDKLDGGVGTDTASYGSATVGVTASLANAAINTGEAKGDTYVSIERLSGSSYADKLYGNSSDNMLIGNAGNDVLSGDGGNDVLHGGAGGDKLDGGAGTDMASYGSATTGVTASLANAAINTGEAKGDTYVSIEQLTGSSYADKLYGNSGVNLLAGGSGNDALDGGSGNDVLYGGAGADDLVGGAGADTFTFKVLSDTTVATSGRDTILDFSGTSGDRIDLSAIDANTAASGNQAFTYVGTAAFTGKAGELRYVKDASDTYVYGDVNGDAKADFAIHLDDAVSLAKGYFVL